MTCAVDSNKMNVQRKDYQFLMSVELNAQSKILKFHHRTRYGAYGLNLESNILLLIIPLDSFYRKKVHGTTNCSPLTKGIIHNCRYTAINSMDEIESFNNIILLHAEVYDHRENPRANHNGPQLDRILERGLLTFPRLTSLDVEAVIEFYNKLQKTSSTYLLPIMPDDYISIKMGYEVLCLPGLAIFWYEAIARVLLEVLPRILPKTDSQVLTLVTVVCTESNNGYDLLWCILTLPVPGFDPAPATPI
jgi:hypothetical protein